MFKYAIVRKPSRSMIDGITDADLGLPDYENAIKQQDEVCSKDGVVKL